MTLQVLSEAMAHLVGGLAALLGRYSMVRTSHASSRRSDNILKVQASETVIGLWRSDLGETGCQPLRVSLLRRGLSRADHCLSIRACFAAL